MRVAVRLCTLATIAAAPLAVARHASPASGVASRPIPAARAPSPGPRGEAVFVYDLTRREMVMFGGNIRDASGQTDRLTSDLWAWNGSAWHQLIPADGVAPPPRGAPHIAYDVARERIVMFGGRTSTLMSDIWEWDGERWHQITSDTTPILHAAVTYDPTRRRVVRYGGIDMNGIVRTTMEWDGRKWRTRDSAGPPGAPLGVVASIAPNGDLTIVAEQSGRSSDSVALLTWTLSQGKWTRRELGPAMTSLQPAASAPDGTIYIYQKSGQWLTRPLMHTRSHAGTWTTVRPQEMPEKDPFPAFAYDPDRRQLLLYGNELWRWDGARWQKSG